MIDPITLPAKERIYRVIGHAFGGRHRVRIREEYQECVRLVLPSWSLSTYDTDALTALVIAAHTYGVRVGIHPCNMQCVSVWLHARQTRDGRDGNANQWERHPSSMDLADRAMRHFHDQSNTILTPPTKEPE